MNSSILSSLKIRGRSLKMFRLDKTRAVSDLNSFETIRYWLFSLSHSIAN